MSEGTPWGARDTPNDERLQLALDAGGLGTWDWDLKRDHIRWDERTARTFGMDLEDFDGSLKMFTTVIHRDDVEPLMSAIRQAIDTCGTFKRDYRVVTPGGESRWVSARGRVICDADGNPDAMLGVVQDRSEAQTIAERLGRTLETIDDAFFSLDHEWRFTYVNAQAERLLRRTRDELLGRVVWEEFPEALGSEFEREYRRVAATGEPATFEAQYGPLASWFEVRAYADPMGIAVHFRDITERRERERRQQRAHATAAALLDRAPMLRAEVEVADVAAAVCSVGTEIFSCQRASLWQLTGDAATLVAQEGGKPLPAGTKVDMTQFAGLAEALAVQEPRFVADTQAVEPAAQRELSQRSGVRSTVYAPIDLGPTSGSLLVTLGWDAVVEPLDDTMLGVVHRFAQEAALGIAQARRREAQQQAARLNAQLQASLLPSPRLFRDELDVDALYRTGERRLMLGGDFYDCLELADGTIVMVIGDVTGHGPQAAAIGATLRAAWRVLALEGMPPGPKVAALDELLRVERDTEEQMVSVCCTVIQPSLGTVTVASAGHPAPVLVTDEDTRLVDVPPGTLLGAPVPVSEPAAFTVGLPDRWAWLLYTDGLPEARLRGSEERVGLDRFVGYVAEGQVLAPGTASPLERLHRRVRRATMPIDDDVALLLLRRG